MSRDLAVYASRADAVALDDLLARVADRGTPAFWRSMFGGSRTARWSMGYLSADESADPAGSITISHEDVDALMRENALAGYGSALTAELRAQLEQSQHMYRLSVPDLADAQRDALLVDVVAAIAETADGVVVDVGSGRVETPAEFASRSAPKGRG